MISDDGSTAGYATIAWPDVDGESFVLEEKRGSKWVAIYNGPDRATTLSGLADGEREYRLKADGVVVGDVLALAIQHHPLSRAWTFFGVGAVMFVILVALLVSGSRKPLPENLSNSVGQ
ncbi:hypothetical protein [Kordiimonas aestuarii]|uniref:hypothetical protein n=1 Tax=Kordiimonas aestuarii TaxID=1005925 RepID=UPI0021CF38A1|nr:hypothetical protein [Kordiimonas aestuarii]